MAPPPSPAITATTLQGCTYLRVFGPLFAPRRTVGTERDRAGNRQLCYEQSASVILLDFFPPVVPSVRGLPQTTTLRQGQARLGGRQTSLGARSEAASVFDAALWHEGVTPLGAPLRPHLPWAEPAGRAQVTAVDGSRLPAVPRMA